MKTIYLIGSLRNPSLPDTAHALRQCGFDVFDSWFAAGDKADESWQAYSDRRGFNFEEALADYSAKHVFAFDKFHIDRADAVVLVMPAGKSGHLELGYGLGRGKPGFVIFETKPERYDVMYQFANGVFVGDNAVGRCAAALTRAFP